MSDTHTDDANSKSGGTGTLKALSIFLILLGLAAMIFPQWASISAELFVGWFMLFGGGFHIVHAIQARAQGGLAWALLVGLVQVAAGVILLAYPLNGVVALTVFLSVVFVVEGAFRAGFAFQIRPQSNWGWVLFSSVMSIVVGVMIYMQLPASALWAVGLLVGINIAFAGWSLLMLALAGTSLADVPSHLVGQGTKDE